MPAWEYPEPPRLSKICQRSGWVTLQLTRWSCRIINQRAAHDRGVIEIFSQFASSIPLLWLNPPKPLHLSNETITMAATNDNSNPYIPLAGVARDGWSTKRPGHCYMLLRYCAVDIWVLDSLTHSPVTARTAAK
ncbi:hypothetical protein BJX96DRAFT_51311 [Aspergillus floccosus]